MGNAFTRAMSTPVPQSEAEDERQVKNSAGGYTFTVDAKNRLERFLILGTDGGTYYASERDITKQNIDFLVKLIKDNTTMVLDTVVDVSTNGRAYKQSPTIFTMALLFKHGGDALKAAARRDFNKVIRTSTHLFEFVQYVELLGGWSRSKRSAVAGWYEGKSAKNLAYQAVKYRQRNGWTHRDVLRLSHPKGVDTQVGNFILDKIENIPDAELGNLPNVIVGFTHAQALAEMGNANDVVNVLDRYPNLPWEALPTQFLKEPDVWKKLFYNGQLNGQALIRNITRLSRIAAFDDMVFARDYASLLVDEEMIATTKPHPINYLNAIVVHNEGQVDRNGAGGFWGYAGSRKKDWNTVPIINDALNNGFHLAFKHVEPAGKRTMIALDVSGSMSSPANGLDLSCAQVTAAMSMTVARTEPYYTIRGFAGELKDLGISPAMGLDSVMRRVQLDNFGNTDCSLPMIWALKNKVEVDTFLVMTDNETWAGYIHPHVALRNYRDKMGIDAKLAVAGITATDFTIADPQDRGMMDFVGADSNFPKVFANFSAGRI